MKTQMHEKQRYLVLSAMFAAIIALTITYLFHIPTGVTGYIHLGDAFIYLAGSFLPAPYACAAAALGGGLADIMSGSAIWAIPTRCSTAAISSRCLAQALFRLLAIMWQKPSCTATGLQLWQAWDQT